MKEPPVRLCCGQRHWGVQCPDGLIMCQLCFKRFEIFDLHQLKDMTYEDVCQKCAELEEKNAG